MAILQKLKAFFRRLPHRAQPPRDVNEAEVSAYQADAAVSPPKSSWREPAEDQTEASKRFHPHREPSPNEDVEETVRPDTHTRP